MPGDPQKVLVTSNDSRLRVYDDLELCAKYKGLSNCTTLFNLFQKKKKKTALVTLISLLPVVEPFLHPFLLLQFLLN
jgi:hypothetical protein